MADQRGNLVAALAQRRDGQRDDVQPVEQVLAEAALLDQLQQVRVGRGDDADVDVDGVRFAERVDLARLEKAQQLGLQVESELADLVEKQRAVACGADQARLVALRAGEGAAAMPNSWLSSRSRGMAAQLNGTNAFFARADEV